jgi:hypothetical protein
MSDDLAPMSELCRRAQGDDGAADALHAVTALRTRLDTLERSHVGDMLGEGATWSQIAATLGITRQAAHHRYRHLPRCKAAPAPSAEVQRMLVTSAARGTVRLARAEAAALGAPAVGTEHLLLALASTSPEPVARVLADAGVDEHALRSTLQPTIVAAPGDANPCANGFTRHAREVLEGSLREAVERGEGYIGAAHLLLALLRNPAGGAAQTLAALDVEPDAIFATLAAQA